MPDVKRTSMNLDRELVRAAAEVLGTVGTTETVHEALREVVRIRLRTRLMESDFPVPTFEELRRMRDDVPEDE
jgi:Arc/MetJ family transcription regulator